MTPDHLMAHRYLYYVLGQPVISDREYDHLDAEITPTTDPSHPLNFPGSDMESSYSEPVKQLAQDLLKGK